MSTQNAFAESGTSPGIVVTTHPWWNRFYTLHHLDIRLSARWDAKVHPLPRPLPEAGRIITSIQFRLKIIGVVVLLPSGLYIAQSDRVPFQLTKQSKHGPTPQWTAVFETHIAAIHAVLRQFNASLYPEQRKQIPDISPADYQRRHVSIFKFLSESPDPHTAGECEKSLSRHAF